MLRRTFLATIAASLAAVAGVVRAAVKPPELVKPPDASTFVFRDVLIYGHFVDGIRFLPRSLFVADVVHLHIGVDNYKLVCHGLKELSYDAVDKFLDTYPRALPMRIKRLSPNGDVQIITTDKPVSVMSQFNGKVVGISERGRKIYQTRQVDRNDFSTMPVLHGRLSAFSDDEMRQQRSIELISSIA